MKVYRTTEIAHRIGIHPNTVRLYEELGFITKPVREPNGYRIFTDLHLEQIKLLRMAFKVEVLQNGLRKMAIDIIKNAASCDFEKALCLAESYLLLIQKEQRNAEEAIMITEELLSGCTKEKDESLFTRKEAADYLQISMDALRNWEMNGLLSAKRKQNGYRVYDGEDIKRLKIIRSLRCANYSISSILRMLSAISYNPQANIREVIDTPRDDDDIISVCDKLLTSLQFAERNAHDMVRQLEYMKMQFK